MTTRPPELLLEILEARFRELSSVLICYSGGIDSALLLTIAAKTLGDKCVALTALGPALPRTDLAEAEQYCLELGIKHLLLDAEEMKREGYLANGADRCYHCKSALYDTARREAERLRLSTIVNGVNQDDLGDYRPGLIAAKEREILSPYCELEISKKEIRELSAYLQIPSAKKAASACLASRLPYGTTVSYERLAQIEIFERALHALQLGDIRVRHHDHLAKVEVQLSSLPRAIELREAIIKAGKAAGYQHIALDLEGFRSGSQNEVLEEPLLSSLRPHKKLPILS